MEKQPEKYAKTQPMSDPNSTGDHDVDRLGDKAGLDVSPEEELGLKDKLQQRDQERLDLDIPEKTN